ncbi:MAG: hypothetical protein ACKO13_16515, partial [Cytophagales bacterium]
MKKVKFLTILQFAKIKTEEYMSKLLTKAAFICVLLVGLYNATLAGTPLKNGYYIVVAAYLSNQEEFAQKYSTELNQAGNHAQVGFD